MKIAIDIDEKLQDTEILISCNRLTLESGEQIMVSRQYAEEIKKRLGLT